MSFDTTAAPTRGQRMQVVLEIPGGDPEKFKEFAAKLKQLATDYGVAIGARGTVEAATGRLQK